MHPDEVEIDAVPVARLPRRSIRTSWCKSTSAVGESRRLAAHRTEARARAGAAVPKPVTLVGRRGDAVDSALDFLEGNAVPVRWIDLDSDPLASMLSPRALGDASLPPAIFAAASR